MGVSGPEPSPQGLYRAAYMGAGKRPYPQDTAAIGSRRRDESNYHHRNSVLYGSELTRTITAGSIQSSLYGSGQATVSPGSSGPEGIDDDTRRNGLIGVEEPKLKT